MNLADTAIWLMNFPVTHGYVMVFIAGFSLPGLLILSFRSTGSGGKLASVRSSEGLEEPDRASGARRAVAGVQRWVFRIVAVVVAAAGVLGVLGLIGVPVTSAYIHDNGQPAVATLDGDWVSFTTAVGETYTLPNDFFTPSLYPDRGAWIPTGSDLVVRYLPSHPQAFVIDTTQIAD